MGNNGIFFQILIHMDPGHVALIQKHDISRFKDIRILSFPQIEIFQVRRRSDKGILNIHNGNKGQIPVRSRFCDQAQIQLVLFQTGDGLSSRLAFNGNPHVWVLVDKGLQIRKEHIFTKGIADADAEMADVKLLDPL